MFTYFVLACGYGTLVLTTYHALAGGWSGLASLGNFGSLVIGVPYLSWRAWALRHSRLAPSPSRFTWLLCVSFPVVFGVFWIVAFFMTGASNGF